MRAILFELPRMPFSQGYAVNEIMKATGGWLIEAGDVYPASPGRPDTVDLSDAGLTDAPPGGSLLYVRQAFDAGPVRDVRSIWLDQHDRLRCVRRSLDGGAWEGPGV